MANMRRVISNETLLVVVETNVGGDQHWKKGIWVEEHAVFDNWVSGQLLPDGEGGNSQHGTSPVADLKLSKTLSRVSVVSDRRVQVQWIPVAVRRSQMKVSTERVRKHHFGRKPQTSQHHELTSHQRLPTSTHRPYLLCESFRIPCRQHVEEQS